MLRRRTLLVAALVGLVAPAAIGTGPASAVDQDLVASVAAGPPGTEIVLTSASCVSEGDLEGDGPFVARILRATLVVGTAPDRQSAAIASGFEEAPATLIVPDWVDPDAPAVIEASCLEFGVDDQDEYFQVETPFDPLPFDVEPGAGPSVQQRTFSRTELLAGQAFQVEASGCTIADPAFFDVVVLEGADQVLAGEREAVGEGSGEASTDPMVADVILSNATFGISFSITGDDELTSVDVDETPMDIPPGTYVAFVACGNEDGDLLLYEPQRIEVIGSAPTGDVDLTVPDGSRTATFAGGSCEADELRYRLEAEALDDFDIPTLFAGDEPDARLLVEQAVRARRGLVPGGSAGDGADRTGSWAPGADAGRSTRILEDFLPDVLPVDGGAWSISADAPFDTGFVTGYAMCGDALGDGFVYDPQAAVVDVEPEVVAPPTTVPPPAAPVAIPGTPTYAG